MGRALALGVRTRVPVIRTPAHRDLEDARAHHCRAAPVGAARPHDPFLLGQQGCSQRAKAVSVGMLGEPLQEAGTNSLPLAGVFDQDRQLGGAAATALQLAKATTAAGVAATSAKCSGCPDRASVR